MTFEGRTPDELVAQRLPYVQATRDSYHAFWAQTVRRGTAGAAIRG